MGVLNYKDILLFLIRNLTKDFESGNEKSEYDIEISFLFGSYSKLFPKLFTLKGDESTFSAFTKMIYEYQVSSIPVCDDNKNLLGIIYRRDITFIWRMENFDILGKPVSEFLLFIE